MFKWFKKPKPVIDDREYQGTVLNSKGDVYLKVYTDPTGLHFWLAGSKVTVRLDRKVLPELAKILSKISTRNYFNSRFNWTN